jgi:microcin C transport system substrate-binding protein
MLGTTRRVFLAASSSALALSTPLRRAPSAAEGGPRPVHALAMLAEPKYGPGFAHFGYVNPDAPKGGTVVFWAEGSFDSFNPFIIKGDPAAGSTQPFETLMVGSLDEPFSEYGLLAESVTVPDDLAWVAFDLRPEARWHDGRPVTPEDVVFSFETLTTKGNPFYRAYYANVARAERTGERQVRFTFDGAGQNRELPLIMGQMTVLPRHYYEGREFDRTTLEPPLGSGPYRVKAFDAGRSVTLERVADYWGRDLPVNRGRNNFDTVRYEYYRDSDVALEAFKAGQYDLRLENSAKRWATGYTGPAVDRGLIKVERLPISTAGRMQGYAFNLRRPLFQDRRVREALGYAFDFEWSNKTLFYGQYERIRSYFHGKEALMSSGLPKPEELALLEPFRDRLPPEVFAQEYRPPQTDGSGNIRDNLRQGLRLLRSAGWEVRDGVLTNAATGQRMEFEILLSSADQERIAGPFAQNLERMGARARLRTIDPAQYQRRTDEFDFDVTVEIWGQSSSPGNEQRDFWGSRAADTPGSRNTVGIKDPVVDALVDRIIHAPDRRALEVACHALDRVLLWGHYVVPHFTDRGVRAAYWDKFGRPETLPTEGLDLFAWWIDQGKDTTVASRKPEVATAPPPVQR